MSLRADQSANWEMGLKAIMEDGTITSEEKRKARICGDKITVATADLKPPISELDLEGAFRKHLLNEGYKKSYINNLTSVLYRVIAASQKTPIFHEKASIWQSLINRYNENASVISAAGANYILMWVMAEGVELEPMGQNRLMSFTDFLEARGLNPYESGVRYRRELRKILAFNGLLQSPEKISYELPARYRKILDAMEKIATAPRSTNAAVNLLAEDWETQKAPIRSITWKKNKRNFIRYLQYQIQHGFTGDSWASIAHWKEILRFVIDLNEGQPIAPATAETIVVSIIACLRILRTTGHLKMTDKEFEKSVSEELWQRIDAFEDHFEKGGKAKPDLPPYEKIYRRFYEGVMSDFKKVRSHKSLRTLQNLVIAILAVEFGWRPQDLKSTLCLEHFKERETLDGRKFYFVQYQPSKTFKGKSSMTASAPLPPWFNDIFDSYFSRVKAEKRTGPLFPIAKMSERICRMSFRYLRKKYSANDYRKMLASFFSSHRIPGLYRLTGRVADRRLELITDIEISHYAEGSTNEERLFDVRYGDKVRKILGMTDV